MSVRTIRNNLQLSRKASGIPLQWCGRIAVFCQSYFNKMLIGQAGSIDGKARQEAGVEKRDWEYSEKQEALCIPAQTTK